MKKQKKASDNLHRWYLANTDKLVVLSVFVITVLLMIVLNMPEKKSEYSDTAALYTQKTELRNADCKLTYKPPAMNSSTPIASGAKIKFDYEVNQKVYTNEVFKKTMGVKKMCESINENPQDFEVRYKTENPNESILINKKED